MAGKKYRKDMDSWHQLITSHYFEKKTRKLTTADIRKALNRRITQYNALTQQLSQQAPDDDYHSLRKLLKRIRYLAELDKPAFREMLRQLKHRQQRFGDFQDLHVQIDMLTSFRNGIATEPEALRAVGWEQTAAGLRKLRDELRAFLRAALAPPDRDTPTCPQPPPAHPALRWSARSARSGTP